MLPGQVVGQVLLGGDAIRLVVGVDVALAVPEARGAGVAAAAQVRRHRAALAGAHVGDRRVDAGVGGVRLRRQGVVDDGLGRG